MSDFDKSFLYYTQELTVHLFREGVIGLVPLPPLEHLAVAVSPQSQPALLPELEVPSCGPIQTSAARCAGVDFALEFDLGSETVRELR